jgi:threonyl-tRNA synthetase
VERFFGVLLEHYAGAFPTWLAPVQVTLLGVRDDHDPHVAKVRAQLVAAGLRVEILSADEPLGGRIRKAKMQKVPYVLVIGDDDVANGTLGVNARGKDVDRGVAVETFLERVLAEITSRAATGV